MTACSRPFEFGPKKGSSFRRRAESLLAVVGMLSVLGFLPGVGSAESQVVFRVPGEFGDVGATTFDENGRAVGTSSFAIESKENGTTQMTVKMAIDGGGQNLSLATLAPIAGAAEGAPDGMLRLVEQRSQATRADGVSLDLLVIDHVKGRISCYPPELKLTNPDEPSDETRTEDTTTALAPPDLSRHTPRTGKHVELPEDDRVVNVPMQLLFLPLVNGTIRKLNFQIATCDDGPVVHRMIAVRGPRTRRSKREVIEIRYGPDFGETVAWFASRLLPSFSFWFDARDGSYLGHRMPLHRKGPEILLVRQGFRPPDIGLD